ncbi:jouberin isoform X1 [Alosa alosa]|uniref:jouberin isoform X1 n=1 Tax=Alosa alosa TaxID=278164 RepID=UPI002015280A|nr:jouberin isoform X1 [Alosa alosa]
MPVELEVKTRIDEVFRRYDVVPVVRKKVKKKPDELQENIVLETFKKNLDLTKGTEDHETILHNTYDPAQGSPRFTKNKRREWEVTEKANVNGGAPNQSLLTRVKKKNKRNLPVPPSHDVARVSDHDDWSANRSEVSPVQEYDEGGRGKGKRGKKGRTKGGEDEEEARGGVDADDDLLQEYQQQLEELGGAAGPSFSARAGVLNNEVGKKRKKKKQLKSTEGEISALQEDAQEKRRSGQLDQEEVTEADIESLKSKGKKKKKKKEVLTEESQTEIDLPSRPMFDDSLVLGVYIHRSDRLKTDLLVSHPMVKVHVVDDRTFQYVKKEDANRPVSSFYERDSVDHILPIMTQPFDFKKRKSTVPEWEEQIIFNERFGYLLQEEYNAPRVILFFEILDFMSMEEARTHANADRHERGFRKIAWAFLKLVGTNGVLNTDSRLRLQLYSVPPRAKKMPNTIEVVEWWRKFPRTRYASTLYITIKGLKLPDHVDPSIRSMMALQQERGSTSYSELQNEITRRTNDRLLDSKHNIIKWNRLPGQVCRIPNKPMLAFRGGQMGCFTLRFSHHGLMLAAACADRDAFPVIVYEIPSGKVLTSFNGHLSLVYDLWWSKDDCYLLSTSSDGTVRIWDVERLQNVAQKILPHPCFLYCAQFHPSAQHLVVTGGFDCLLRVWDVDVHDVNGHLLKECEGHIAFVNALCFDQEGGRMFSGDNAGVIIEWNVTVGDASSQNPTRFWKIEREIKEPDLEGVPINCLEVHPNGRRLLIQAKDSTIRVMDLRLLAVKKFTGASNYRERIQSTLTPCGSFIFSGSEDGLAYVWNAETGDQVAVYSELCYPTALRTAAFHPFENMVAFCAYGQSQPIHLYLYDHKVALLEVESMKALTRTGTTDTQTPVTFQDPNVSAMDRFASAARVSLKLQRLQAQLDSVREPYRNTTGADFGYNQGGLSYIGRSHTQEAGVTITVFLSNAAACTMVGLSASLPPPALLSPHSQLHISAPLAAQLLPQAAGATQGRGFSPVGQSRRLSPSLMHMKGSTGFPDSSNVSVDADVPVHQTVVSLYDYTANRSDELTVRRGDVINVLYKDNDSWWFGQLASGQQGYFPATYVVDEKSFDEEMSQAINAEPMFQQEGALSERATPTRMMAAISGSGELKILSEQDTEPEQSTSRIKGKKMKKKVKRREAITASSDSEGPRTGSHRRRPLPPLGKANEAFEPEPNTQRLG